MADRECVLRFLVFTAVSFTEYTVKDFDGFLTDEMAKLNHISDMARQQLSSRFLSAMRLAHEIFGPDAFRKRYAIEARNNPINKALFESWSVALGKLTDDKAARLVVRTNEVKQRSIELMNDTKFDNAVSVGTGEVSKVHLRFSSIDRLITEVLK